MSKNKQVSFLEGILPLGYYTDPYVRTLNTTVIDFLQSDKKLFIAEMPRQSFKTTLFGIHLIDFLLQQNNFNILYATYDYNVAKNVCNGRDVTAIGPGTNICGYGYDFIIVDDVNRNEVFPDKLKEWVVSHLLPRLYQGSKMFLIGSRKDEQLDFLYRVYISMMENEATYHIVDDSETLLHKWL